MAKELTQELKFKVQIERIEAKLKVSKDHASGPRKPSMSQQEHGE
jgi:hypothetical protein